MLLKVKPKKELFNIKFHQKKVFLIAFFKALFFYELYIVIVALKNINHIIIGFNTTNKTTIYNFIIITFWIAQF